MADPEFVEVGAVKDAVVKADVVRPDVGDQPVVGRGVVARLGRCLVVVGLVGVAIGAFLPWVYSGAATRNSFGVVRAARRLGVVDSDALRALLGLWYFVPFLAAVAVLLLLVGRYRAAGSVAFVLGTIVLVVAVMVSTSSVDRGVGPAIASVAGVVAALGGLLVLLVPDGGRSARQ